MVHRAICRWVSESVEGNESFRDFDPSRLEYSLIHAADRNVYRIESPDTDRFLVLKVWIAGADGAPGKKTAGSIVDEFDKTRKAHRVWLSRCRPGLTIVEPIAVSEPLNSLLLTGCSGEDFSKYLNARILAWPFWRRAFLDRVYLAGQWLGAFHSGSLRNAEGKCYIEVRRAQFLHLLHRVSVGGGDLSVSRPVAEKSQALMNSADKVPAALIHGNYALRNILVASHSVAAIDFEESRYECPAYDVGQFIAELIVRKFLPGISEGLIAELITKFQNAYAQEVSLERSLVNAYVGYHLLAFYAEHVQRTSPNILDRRRRDHILNELKSWLNMSESTFS